MAQEGSSIGDDEFSRIFIIPGLKRHEVKKAVHLEAFCGRLKPKPKFKKNLASAEGLGNRSFTEVKFCQTIIRFWFFLNYLITTVC